MDPVTQPPRQPAHDHASVVWARPAAEPGGPDITRRLDLHYVASPEGFAKTHVASTVQAGKLDRFSRASEGINAQVSTRQPSVVEAARGVQELIEQAGARGLLPRSRDGRGALPVDHVRIELRYDAHYPDPASLTVPIDEVPAALRDAVEAAMQLHAEQIGQIVAT